ALILQWVAKRARPKVARDRGAAPSLANGGMVRRRAEPEAVNAVLSPRTPCTQLYTPREESPDRRSVQDQYFKQLWTRSTSQWRLRKSASIQPVAYHWAVQLLSSRSLDQAC